jgi:hypothetical protein
VSHPLSEDPCVTSTVQVTVDLSTPTAPSLRAAVRPGVPPHGTTAPEPNRPAGQRAGRDFWEEVHLRGTFAGESSSRHLNPP